MIDWSALAHTNFSQKRPDPTAKTDKTPLSSVLSVPVQRSNENSDAVSSVLTVLPGHPSEKRESGFVSFVGAIPTPVEKIDVPSSGSNPLPPYPATYPDDVKGALIDEDSGAPYLPWCGLITPEQLEGWRTELWAAVGELADIEGWTDSMRDDIAYRLDRGPVSAVRPDITYFRERLVEARAALRSRNNND